MKCPRCQAENPETTRFCGQCGIRIDAACPHCGQPVGTASKCCSARGEAAVARLALSFPEVSETDGPLEWIDSLVFRGVRSLPARFEAGRR